MLRPGVKKLFVGERVTDVPDHYELRGPIDCRGVFAISCFSSWALGPGVNGTTAPSGAAWPAANRAIFAPFRVPVPVTATKIVIGGGATAGGNYDVGIYKPDGTRLVSSGTLARTAAAENVADITDTTLMPGMYYLAIALDGVNTIVSFPHVSALATYPKLLGMREMATAFTLPSTATFATTSANYIPCWAIILREETSQVRARPQWPPLNVITPGHVDSLGMQMAALNNPMGSSASVAPGANRILYVPFKVSEFSLAVKMSLMVGATQNGNVDVGIYNGAGTRLVSTGSTVLGVVSTLQEFDIADTLLAPGTYRMAVQLSSGTGTIFAATVNDEILLSSVPMFEESPAFGLPATFAGVLSTAASYPVPTMGVHFDTLL